MPNYTHVQFISWELYTGPNRGGPPPWSRDTTGISYTGVGNANADDSRLDIEAQIVDIEQRVQFTYNAIKMADEAATKQPSTLKVFMGPEFLYRGRGGAYIHDLINGWVKAPPAEFNLDGHEGFSGLFGSLQGLAIEFDHWLFVFGTAISASFPARTTEHGKWVLDANQKGEIYNTALIQPGGQGRTYDAYATRKHYISGIDFIKQYLGSKAFTDGDVVPADRADLEPNEDDREGSAIFKINGVNDKDAQPIIFGLEVCLDHAHSTGIDGKRNDWGRIHTANKLVKIQLVPSGGMALRADSIRLLPAVGSTPHFYAFNCDGLSTAMAPITAESDWQWGAHTQIWNGTGQPLPPAVRLIEASYGQHAPKTTLIKVDNELNWAGRDIGASNLWDEGAGYVRVMQELPL
jgi:hypothetical protein